MILLEEPYVSDYLQKTVKETGYPVLRNRFARQLPYSDGFNFISDKDAVKLFKENKRHPLYTNSENALAWVNQKLDFTPIPDITRQFKDKFAFREIIQDLYPAYFFKKVKINDLADILLNELKFPLVIKPSVGFLSLGIKVVYNPKLWASVTKELREEIRENTVLLPKEVIGFEDFILEEYISGEEFALDAFFKQDGQVVITNIMKHRFAGKHDVSDRVYVTSKQIIRDNLSDFSRFLQEIGNRTGLRNYPVHLELRRNESGNITPIELNPLRFGGWCTIPDVTPHAFGFNPYEYLFEQKEVPWSKICAKPDNTVYSMILLNNSTGIAPDEIASFNYEALAQSFKKVLEVRKVDFRKHPLFGFVFTETEAGREEELDKILKSDLREFIRTK